MRQCSEYHSVAIQLQVLLYIHNSLSGIPVCKDNPEIHSWIHPFSDCGNWFREVDLIVWEELPITLW